MDKLLEHKDWRLTEFCLTNAVIFTLNIAKLHWAAFKNVSCKLHFQDPCQSWIYLTWIYRKTYIYFYSLYSMPFISTVAILSLWYWLAFVENEKDNLFHINSNPTLSYVFFSSFNQNNMALDSLAEKTSLWKWTQAMNTFLLINIEICHSRLDFPFKYAIIPILKVKSWIISLKKETHQKYSVRSKNLEEEKYNFLNLSQNWRTPFYLCEWHSIKWLI